MENCKYKLTLSNGVTVYHNGFKLSQEQQDEINRVFSRCWDKLPKEKKIEINNKMIEKGVEEVQNMEVS